MLPRALNIIGSMRAPYMVQLAVAACSALILLSPPVFAGGGYQFQFGPRSSQPNNMRTEVVNGAVTDQKRALDRIFAAPDSVTTLRLVNIQLSADDCKQLQQLHNLRNFELIQTELADWQPLLYLPDLELISISDSSTLLFSKHTRSRTVSQSSVDALSSLPHIRSIDISGDLSGISLQPLSNSKQLENIAISDSAVDELALEQMGKCKSLKQLSITSSKSIGRLSALKAAPTLSDLSLDNCPIDLQAFSTITELQHLTKLSVSGSNFSDDCAKVIPDMPALQSLHLSNTPISRAGLEHIAASPTLRKMYLFAMDLPKESLSCISNLVHLQELSVPYLLLEDKRSAKSAWTSDTLCFLQALSDLTFLDLSGEKINFDSLQPLFHCRNLQTLILKDTEVSDSALPSIGRLPKLQVLDLAGTQVQGRNLNVLAHAPLRNLNLANCNLSDDAVAGLASLTHLCALDLSGSAISDSQIEMLQTLRSLQSLKLEEMQCATAFGAKQLSSKLKDCQISGSRGFIDAEGFGDLTSAVLALGPCGDTAKKLRQAELELSINQPIVAEQLCREAQSALPACESWLQSQLQKGTNDAVPSVSPISNRLRLAIDGILVNALLKQGKRQDARSVAKEAYSMCWCTRNYNDLYRAELNEFKTLLLAGDKKQAQNALNRFLALTEYAYGGYVPSIADSQEAIARAYLAAKDYPRAAEFQKKSFEGLKESFGQEHPRVAISEALNGSILARQGKFREAEARFKTAIATDARFVGPHRLELAQIYRDYAEMLLACGRKADAELARNKATDTATDKEKLAPKSVETILPENKHSPDPALHH